VGLTSVEEAPTGGEAKGYYIDGVKYANVASAEEFSATINAYMYPDEFGPCEGTHQPRSGLFITQQRRKSFGLSYRTLIGNDLTPDHGYKIHIIYNALAAPTPRANATITGDSGELNTFSWSITTRPPVISRYKPMAHVVIDSRFTDPAVLSLVEDTLYGSETDSAYLPSFTELIDIFDVISSLTVVDNGDGTWTATAPFDSIQMLETDLFEITSSAAVFVDEDTYTISSE
jgi:hypothetical protein